MGKNFDKENEDREYTLSGQVFHWRHIPWREQGEWFDDSIEKALARQAEIEKAQKQAEAEGKTLDPALADRTPLVKTLEDVVTSIVHYTEVDERERLSEVMESKDKPVTIAQLNEIATWMQEVQTERPTTSPADSSPGDGSIAPTSQDE